MQPEPRLVGLGLTFAALLATANADAQLSYKLAPVGGRSELLGGTGMVYGRDASAAYLNPATAVLVDDRRLSFSVNFYRFSITHSPDWYAPGPVDRSKFGNVDPKSSSLTSVDFDTLPSSLCLFLVSTKLHILDSVKDKPLLKDAHFGFCFATVADEEFNFASVALNAARAGGTTRQVQTVSQTFRKFSAGPTYAVRVTNALSLGASIDGSVVSYKSLLEAGAVSFQTPVSPIASSFYAASRGSDFTMEATVGATYRFGKQTVGISLRSPSVHIWGVGGVNRNTSVSEAGNNNTDTLSATGSFVSQSPLRVGIGTGLEGVWGLFEVNAFYFQPLNNSYHVQFTGNQTTTNNATVVDQPISLDLYQKSRGVVDMAAGAELYMSDRISLMMGASTDITAAPSGSLRGTLFNYFEDRSNRLSATIGMGTHGTLGELMFGAQLQYGWGQRLAVNSYQLPPTVNGVGDEQFGLMLIIAGTTSLRNLQRAYEDVKKVVNQPTPQKPVMEPTPGKPLNLPNPLD